MRLNASPAIIAALTWLASVCVAGTVFLVYVDKPYVAISTLSTSIVTSLLVLAGVKSGSESSSGSSSAGK